MDSETGFGRDGKNKLVSIVHQGTTYELVGMDDKDFLEVEAHLMKARKNPLLAIKAQLEGIKDDPALQEMLVDRAYRDLRKGDAVDVVTRKEVMEYLDTREGAAMSIWMMLRKKDAGMTLARATEIMSEVSTAEALKKRDAASKEYIEKAGLTPPREE